MLLYVCLFVCLSDKCQNWSGPILCVISRGPREDLWLIKISKICLHQNSIFINFEKIQKSTIFFNEIRELFCFVLQYTQSEHVPNWNRRWAQSSLKPSIYIICLSVRTFVSNKAKSFTRHLISEMGLFTLHNCCVLCSWLFKVIILV